MPMLMSTLKKARPRELRVHLRQPWLLSILCAALIPLFPEYITPLLAIGALLAAWRDARAAGRSLVIGRLGSLLLIYTLLVAVGILYSSDPLYSTGTTLMWICGLLVYLAAINVLTDRQRMDTALVSLSVTAGLVGAVACVQYILRAMIGVKISVGFWDWVDSLVLQFLPVQVMLSDTGTRVCGTFSNPNVLAEYLMMVIPFVIYYAFMGRHAAARIVCRICLLLAVAGVVFTFSRTTYFALGVIALFLGIANRRRIMLILLSVGSALILMPQSVIARLVTVTVSDAALNERFDIWASCLESIARHPLFGIGSGIQNTWDMLVESGVQAPHAHNLFLEVLVEGGIVLLLALLLVGYRAARIGWTVLRRSDDTQMLGVILLAFLAGFFVNALMEYPFMTPRLVAVFFCVMALFDSAVRLYAEQPPALLADCLHWSPRVKQGGRNMPLHTLRRRRS